MTIRLELKNTGTETLTLEPDQTITVEVVTGEPEPLTFADAVTEWTAAHEDDRVITGGLDPYSTDTGLGTGSGGGTFFDLALTRAIRQHGPITAVRLDFSAIGPVRVQIWRPDGAGNLALIEETATFTPTATGEYLYVLPTPLVLAQPGDVPGIWGDAATLRCKQVTTIETGWASGAPTTIDLSSVPTGYQYNRILGLTFYGPPPFLGYLGDSQLCAHGAVLHRPFLDGGPSGGVTGEPAKYIRDEVPAITHQNFSKGSQTWAWGAATVSRVAAVTPRAIICHFGVNDVDAARSWAAIEDDMDAVKAGLPTGCKMFVNEVLPYTGGNDTKAAAIRSLNANYATWCAANGATLIQCHDDMGQIRTSTGELDDLKTAYDYDAVHLTVPNGIGAFSTIMYDALSAHDWSA